ncbi:uncharacterized protein VICG_00823 [Vittaforma corneae ATCC 50505]|uniref:Rad21/Rec8-like protein N-terminal domain-containing protein n=1 Tax=Vittaforma corneae (strain ATCC 50505) TaxID=993615 RepID=L2GNW4_VITCO|nr:uncharacterized protein VICG_00823 [Vittaforma corneae ATCC 50505]ELA42180.1 hypothetical protein VICG_00823 [Vittaforma corneae ATCC 50505]
MQNDSFQSTHELLHKIVYAEKKVSKQQIKNINISLVIEDCVAETIALKQVSIIILALSKILNRRFKALAEDCGNFLHLLATKKANRVPSSRNITLNVETTGICIDDEMVDLEREDVIEAIETSAFADRLESIGLDMDFREAPSIEQARDSTVVSGPLSVMDETGITVAVKRRRMIEDRTIEISETIFKGNLRNVSDLLRREQVVPENIFESSIWIDPRVEKLFEKIAAERSVVERSAIEEQRHASVGFEMEAPDFSFYPVEEAKPQKEEIPSVIFDISTLPDTFVFNSIVQYYNIVDKASSFISLLVHATHGRITASQSVPFGSIECRIVKRELQ